MTGKNSTWTNSGELDVGYYGTGTLTISDGAYVSSATSYISYFDNSSGYVTVTGTGSEWINSGLMKIGLYDTGTLTISDSGLVATGSVSVYSSGVIYLDGGYLAVEGELDSDAISDLIDDIKVGTSDSYEDAELGTNVYTYYFSSSGTSDTYTGYSLNGYTVFTSVVITVPEPATCALFGGIGALGLVLIRRKRQTA